MEESNEPIKNRDKKLKKKMNTGKTGKESIVEKVFAPGEYEFVNGVERGRKGS